MGLDAGAAGFASFLADFLCSLSFLAVFSFFSFFVTDFLGADLCGALFGLSAEVDLCVGSMLLLGCALATTAASFLFMQFA